MEETDNLTKWILRRQCMYLVLVKNDGKHVLYGIGETLDEVKKMIKKGKIDDKIENGKAYLIKGDIKLIRPETTPELLDVKNIKSEEKGYY